jgi:hypothetical protein
LAVAVPRRFADISHFNETVSAHSVSSSHFESPEFD